MIDAYASAPWYVDHLKPITAALGPDFGRLYLKERREVALPGGPQPILVVAYGDLAAVRRMGRTNIVLGRHGIAQTYLDEAGNLLRHPAVPGGLNTGDIGLFLVPNATSRDMILRRYRWANIALVGCPKLDSLPARVRDGTERIIAVSTHWNGTTAPETRSSWPWFGAALLRLARRYKVLGHGHPRMLDHLRRPYEGAGIEVVPSFEEVCRRADLYITDNSSSLYEFAATGRPVVVLNPPIYRPHHRHGLRFWDAAGVGVNVWDPDKLAAAVERAFELRPEDVAAREAALDIVYQPRTGSPGLAADAIRAWVDSVG